jgi:hypothetical protein
MRGSYTGFIARQVINGTSSVKTDAVEVATALHKEACELRLARIQNGKEPSHQNGRACCGAAKKGKSMK